MGGRGPPHVFPGLHLFRLLESPALPRGTVLVSTSLSPLSRELVAFGYTSQQPGATRDRAVPQRLAPSLLLHPSGVSFGPGPARVLLSDARAYRLRLVLGMVRPMDHRAASCSPGSSQPA